MNYLKVSPKQLLILVSVCALLLAAFSAYLSTNMLSTGIQYVATDLTQTDEIGITIKQVLSGSSAQSSGLSKGTTLIAIRKSGKNWFQLKATDVLEEPDLLANYDDFFTFLDRQDALYQMMSAPSFELKDAQGKIYHLQAHAQKLTEIPFIYWFQVICGLIAVLTGFSVFVFRQNDPASLQYAINGSSFLLITLAASVYSSRELALPAALFYTLNLINHFGALVFSATFVSLFFLYPQRLARFSWHWFLLGIFVLLAIADWLVIFPSHDDSIRLPIILALLVSMILAVIQRYKNRNKLVEKAALRWFVLSLLIGGGLFVLISIFLSYIGMHSDIPQGYSLGFILIMYIGIALGITRYQLFQLERWWLAIWMWVLGGCVLLSFDALLTYSLGMRQDLSLGLSLALIGWLYFPMRQWIAKKLFHRKLISIQDVFPQVLTLLLSSSHKIVLNQKWQELLGQLFQPIQLNQLVSTQQSVSLSHSGERLLIPSMVENELFELHFPDQGKRFFTQRDLKLAQGLWQLLSHALVEKDAFEKGSAEERKRIGRDLHDDIGTRLLTLMHKANDNELVDIAKDAMQDLRLVLNSLDDKPRVLMDSLGDWRGEIEERCQLCDISLNWQQDDVPEQVMISSRQFINLQRVIRETITNALKHSHPHYCDVQITLNNLLTIDITHDGCLTNMDDWINGRGLTNLDFRMNELSGHIKREQNKDKIKTQITLEIAE